MQFNRDTHAEVSLRSVPYMARILLLHAALLLACCACGANAAADTIPAPPGSPYRTSWLADVRKAVRRMKVTARWAWLRATGSVPAPPRRRLQSSLPSSPDACNPQYDSQQSFSGQQTFVTANGACVTAFADCMTQIDPNTSCTGDCTASIDILQSSCDNTYCEISGDNEHPADGSLPSYTYRSADCLPDDCDAGQHDAQQAYYRGQLCGALWSVPDCNINLTCAYDLSSNTIWIIVGSIVGFFVLVMTVLVTWWCIVKRRLDAERAAGGEEEEEGEYDQFESEDAPLHPGGATYADMPRSRGGMGNDAVLNAGEDRL